jgi:uncharacterized protein (DUF885 family)
MTHLPVAAQRIPWTRILRNAGDSRLVISDYIPHCRTTLSVNSLGGGERRYQAALRRFTTTDLTAAQIHEIGLKEVHRITEEMAALAKANGYKDLASFRDRIENDPKYKPASADAIVEDFRKYIAQMEPRLPQLFNLLPKTAVTVEPIPPFQAAAATHYQGGTPDGKRPGRVSVAVSDPTIAPLSMMRPSLIMRVFPAIIYRSPFSSR